MCLRQPRCTCQLSATRILLWITAILAISSALYVLLFAIRLFVWLIFRYQHIFQQIIIISCCCLLTVLFYVFFIAYNSADYTYSFSTRFIGLLLFCVITTQQFMQYYINTLYNISFFNIIIHLSFILLIHHLQNERILINYNHINDKYIKLCDIFWYFVIVCNLIILLFNFNCPRIQFFFACISIVFYLCLNYTQINWKQNVNGMTYNASALLLLLFCVISTTNEELDAMDLFSLNAQILFIALTVCKLFLRQMSDIAQMQKTDAYKHKMSTKWLNDKQMQNTEMVHNMQNKLDIFLPNGINKIILNFSKLLMYKSFDELLIARQHFIILGKNTYCIDHAIFAKICCDRIHTHIIGKNIIAQYGKSNYTEMDELLHTAMFYENQYMLQMIIKHRIELFSKHSHRQYKILRDLLCFAAKRKLQNVCKYLLNDKNRKFIQFEPRPICLLNALKTRNEKIIKVILCGLMRVKHFYFVCDDVFKECIRMDHIWNATILVEHFRYIPNENDYFLAQKYNQAIHIWLQQRAESFCIDNDFCGDTVNLSDWDD